MAAANHDRFREFDRIEEELLEDAEVVLLDAPNAEVEILVSQCSTPSVISQRIRDFQPPEGFNLFKTKREENSIAYSYGVRVVKAGQAPAGVNGFKEGFYYCLASDTCFQKKTGFQM